MRTRVNINCSKVWISPDYPMNQAVVEPDGRRVHLTGQVAWDVNSNVLHHNDAAAQTKAAFENIESVLSEIEGTGSVMG